MKGRREEGRKEGKTTGKRRENNDRGYMKMKWKENKQKRREHKGKEKREYREKK